MENDPPLNPSEVMQEVAPTPVIEIKKKFNFKSSKFIKILILGIFLVLVAAASFLLYRINFLVGHKKADYLAIVSTSPTGTTQNVRPRIAIKFNLPVTAHHINEYFTVAPYLKGQVVQGSSPEEVFFEPEDRFAPGTIVTVLLKAGLPSDAGKKLLNDYSFTFNIAYDANTISFTNNDWAGKFMSFQASKGADITLKVGEGIKSPGLKIYKADSSLLLNSLVYSSTSRTYLEKPVDIKKLTLLKDFGEIKNDQKLNFKEEVGIYYFEGSENGSPISSAWIALNETAIHLRQDDQKVYLAAQNLGTGAPDGAIDLTFYELGDSTKVVAQHTLSGIQEYPLHLPQKLDLVVAKKGNDTMIIPVSIPNSQAEIRLYSDLDKKHVVFLYTDRPIYKKGDKVSFRGVIRQDNDGIYQAPTVNKIKVYRYTGNTNQKVEQVVDIKEGGIFSGEFRISQDENQPYQSLYASTELLGQNYSEGYANFDVFEYTKPSFGLDVAVEKSEYTRGDKVKATLSGKYFNGNPMANQKIAYTVYSRDYYETEKVAYNSSFKLNGWGGMCGGGGFDDYYGEPVEKPKEITLDTQGNAVVEFSTNQTNSVVSQEFTLVAEKVDENGNKILAAKNTIIHQGEFNIFFRPGPMRVAFGEDFNTVFYAEDSSGNKMGNKSFKYDIFEEVWTAGVSVPERKIVKSSTIQTDESGTGAFKEKIDSQDQQKYYVVSIYGDDSRKNKIEARRNVWFFDKSVKQQYGGFSSSLDQTVLKITSLKTSLGIGENAKLEIISPDDITVFTTFERGRVYTPQWLNLKKGVNIFEFPVIANYAPSIGPTFSFFYNGQYYIEGLSLNVPALQKLINIEISKDKEKYNPGDTAIITIKTKDSAGNLISADLGVGIVDKAIFALRKNAAPPIHSFFYFFRGRSVNTSSSLSWIAMYDWGGGGGGGGGASTFLKDVDTLYWNPNLKTESNGEIKIEVPVGSAITTWKILTYASTDDTKVGQGDLDFLVSH